jgi:hypothetical protein
MDICEKKHQIQEFLNDIYTEYNRMNESKIQSKCESDLEMRTMITNIRSLERTHLDKDNHIKLLEKTIYDYEKIIEDLNSKLEIKEEYEKESDRHDMLRIQAKEITEKSREIDRLNNLLEFHKKEKSKSKKIDNILHTVSKKEKNKDINLQEVIEPVNEETGEVNPNFIYPSPEPEPSPGGSIDMETSITDLRLELIEPITTIDGPQSFVSPEGSLDDNKEEVKEEVKKDKKIEEKIEVKIEVKEEVKIEEKIEVKIEEKIEVKEELKIDKKEIKETPEEIEENIKKIERVGVPNKKDSEEVKKLMRVKSKNNYYFVYKGDNPQDVYEYNEEKRADKIIGKRTKIDGKYKLELF